MSHYPTASALRGYHFKGALELRIELLVLLPNDFDFLWHGKEVEGSRLEIINETPNRMANLLHGYIRRCDRVIYGIGADGQFQEDLTPLSKHELMERLKTVREIHMGRCENAQPSDVVKQDTSLTS